MTPHDKTIALVTGASQGIGLEVTRQLAQLGMTVLLTGRHAEKTNNAAGVRSVQVGAAGIVWAATLPDEGPSGGFFRDGQPLSW